jgi:hypothetical protein
MSARKPYSIARAELIAEQIARFATQHVHQIAGHRANLAFWIAEAASAAQTIDEYQQRFRQLRNAQVSWVQEHKTRITRFCAICRGPCEFSPEAPDPPHRVSWRDLAAAREGVRQAVRQFLVRLFHAGLVSEAEAQGAAGQVGTLIEPEDFDAPPR